MVKHRVIGGILSAVAFLVLGLARSETTSEVVLGDVPGPPSIRTVAILQDEAAARLDRAGVISAMAVDPSGTLLATCGDDHLLRIWDVKSLELLGRGVGHTDWVRAVVFVPPGSELVTAGQDGRILLWGLQRSQEGWNLSPPVALDRWQEAIFVLAVCPAGQRLVAGGFEGKLVVFDLTAKKPLAPLQGPGRDLRVAQFSPSGDLLAVAGRQGTIRLWKTNTWELLGDLAGHHRRVRALVFSPDGNQLASAGEDHRLIIWDVQTVTQVNQITLTTPATAICWCGPNRLAIGSTDNIIRLIQLPGGNTLAMLAGHTGTVSCLLWQAEADRLLSGSFDTTIRFWFLGTVESIAMSPR